MAHVIDFTLFYGGVASAPVAELPFAGSSFDVQKGVGRRAVFGVPEVESVAIVKMGAVTGAVSEFGESALSYTALWEDAGGATHTASVGAVGVSTGVEIGELSAGKRAIGLGEPEAYSTCSAGIDSVPEQKPAFGELTVLQAATVTFDGLAYEEAFGQLNLAVIIRPDSLVCGSVIGGVDLIPAHSADMTAVVQAAVFGGPDVGFGLIVESAGVGPRDYTFGSPAYSWRKCPRWDLLAKLQKEAEFGAEIRPAPVAAQVWRGEGCVCRARTIEAMVARWTDLHTIAHPKNAMDAAVRRKEQI